MALTKRQVLQQRHAKLRQARARWDTEVREITEQMAPYRTNFESEQSSERNRGERKDDQILNGRPLRAIGICNAGLSAGLASPARPWFNLSLSNKSLAKVPAIRLYLDQVRQIMLDVLAASNFYSVLSNDTNTDVSSIGTAPLLMEDDDRGGVNFEPFIWGEYVLDRNAKGEVDTFFRRRMRTVREIVQEYGLENCSTGVQRAWREQRFHELYAVVHAVYPRADRQAGAYDARGMAYVSCHYEESNPNPNQFLRESGYREFPLLVPVWSRRGNDAYGRGPGWEARGYCKALQHRETRRAQVADLIVEPPTVRKGDIEGVNLLPGGVTHVGIGQDANVETLHTVDPEALGVLREEIQSLEVQLDETFFVNLWLATLRDSEAQGPRPTATEVQARKVEVMLMLGPLLQNSEQGFLKPLVARLYASLDRNNMLPYPPDELLEAGVGFEIEFISILHTAQQAANTGGLQAFVAEVLAAANINPEVLDKVNVDAIVDQFAQAYGVSPEIIRSSEEVKKLRDARSRAQQAAEEGQAAVAGAGAIKDLSASDPAKLQQLAASLGPSLPAVAEAQTRGLLQ